jgi:serine/threonine protein kinase
MDINELIGMTLGTCTLERVIGRGGMGAVFLAQQSRPVRTVAVKVLIPAKGYDPDQQRVFLARFRREADTIAKLDHRNILPIYEYDEAVVDQEQVAYLVMPFIRGGTLRERIEEMKRAGTQFDLNTTASYVNQIADALSYAHGIGVVHRDVKPANLLFHQDGRLLLSDFGIARLQAMPSLTSAGSFLGTAEYASPEQISTNSIDHRADIYSVGAILFELLAGSVPYTGANPFSIMGKKLNDPVPSVRALRSNLSPAIDAVVTRALAKSPADRYQSASQLAADFRAAIAGQPSISYSGIDIYSDLTLADASWPDAALFAPPVQSASSAATIPAPNTNGVVPPTQQALPSTPLPNPWQQQAQQGQQAAWQWPSQTANANGSNNGANGQGMAPPLTTGIGNANASGSPNKNTTGPDILGYRKGHRISFYSILLITLLLQIIVAGLLLGKSTYSSNLLAMLGVLMGSSLNLLALAASCFTGVVRDRKTGKFVVRGLINALIAPILSGLLIDFGTQPTGNLQHLLAYAVLLLSNIYALVQLAHVDAAKEQIQITRIHWRSAFVGALTGILPLTIVLIFALNNVLAQLHSASPLLAWFGTLSIIFLGIPTPGAVLAVHLSRDARFPTLVRSSAIAGMLMFLGALLLLIIWDFLFSHHAQYIASMQQGLIPLLILLAVLMLIGALRGMLDAWIYNKIRK